MVKDIMANGKVGEKKAKGQVYDFIIQQLPDTKRNNLYVQTHRAIKIFNLFEKIGIDKIRCITTYSANSISKLSKEELQEVIKTFSSNDDTDSNCLVPEGPFRQQTSEISFTSVKNYLI